MSWSTCKMRINDRCEIQMWEREIEARKGTYREPKLPSMGTIVDGGTADKTGGSTDEKDNIDYSIIWKCVWNIQVEKTASVTEILENNKIELDI